MNIREVAVAFTAYNRWVNQQIYDAAAGLSDADRRRALGAAFGSVQGTLEHLIVADRLWLQRFRGEPLAAAADRRRELTFDELRTWRLETDADLERWASGVDPDFADPPFHFTSVAYNRERTVPGWSAVLHLFNHQTHHRGQVMAMLRQLGQPAGLIADFVWAPFFDAESPRP